MNKHILTFIVIVAFALAARAETTVTISDVHLCCPKCVKGVEKAVAPVTGAQAAADKETKIVTITAPDAATAQKAVDAIVAAGYFGKSSDAAIKVASDSGAKDTKVTSITVKGTHLCCDKCVKGVTAALSEVKGVTENTAVKGADSFEIKGDFNAKEAFAALEKAGYSGKAAN